MNLNNQQLYKQYKNVLYRINEEGLDYCFMDYSDWNEIDDPKFQELKNNYTTAAKEIITFLINTIENYEQNNI
jgi:hypothetical protein